MPMVCSITSRTATRPSPLARLHSICASTPRSMTDTTPRT